MFYDRIIDIAGSQVLNHPSRLISAASRVLTAAIRVLPAASRVLPPLTNYMETPAINDAVLLFLSFMVLPPK